MEKDLTRENVPEQSQRERDGTERDRDQLDDPNHKEDHCDKPANEASHASLRREGVLDKAHHPHLLDRDPKPHEHEDRCHSQGQVQVRSRIPHQRDLDLRNREWARARSVADGADPWDQTAPVGEQDKDKDGGQERENLGGDVLAHNPFHLPEEKFDHRLERILGGVRHQCHPGRGLGSQKQNSHRNRGGYDDRVRQPCGKRKFFRLNGDCQQGIQFEQG